MNHIVRTGLTLARLADVVLESSAAAPRAPVTAVSGHRYSADSGKAEAR